MAVINCTFRVNSKPFVRFKVQPVGPEATIPSHSLIITGMRTQIGFTLIELMVALAILGIVVGFGVPQISRIVQNNRLVASLNSLSAHLTYARSEAVKRSTNVSVAPLTPPNWLLGWQVFVDQNADGILDPGEQQLRVVDDFNIPNATILPAGNFVTYDRLGVATDRLLGADPLAAEKFTLTAPPSPNQTITISKTGHVTIP